MHWPDTTLGGGEDASGGEAAGGGERDVVGGCSGLGGDGDKGFGGGGCGGLATGGGGDTAVGGGGGGESVGGSAGGGLAADAGVTLVQLPSVEEVDETRKIRTPPVGRYPKPFMPTTDTSAPLANAVAGFSESALLRATNWEAGADAVAATSASEQNRQPYAHEEPHTSGQLALAM